MELGEIYMKAQKFQIMVRRGLVKLQDGLVIAIEPMINMGKEYNQHSDGWTITTIDNKTICTF